MSEAQSKNLLLVYGPPVAILSFLVAFWASGMVLPPPAGDVTASAPVDAGSSQPEDSSSSQPATSQPETLDRDTTDRTSGESPEKAASKPKPKKKAAKSAPKPVAIDPNGEYAKLVVASPKFEFGTVFEGDVVKHEFEIVNEGDAELVISKVKTSCGCTVAEYTEDPIPPGGKGVVDIEFKTKSRKGAQKKTIFVHSNDPRNQQQKLYIQGKVQPQFWIDPRERIDLGTIDRNTPVEDREVTVKWLKDLDVEITGLVVRNDAIKVTQEPWEDELHRGAVLTLSISDPAALLQNGQISRINESIQIQTNNDRFKRQFLFVSGVIEREIMVRPHAVTFGVAKPDTDAERKLVLNVKDGVDLPLPELSCPLDYVDFFIEPSAKGNDYDIRAKLRAADAPQGDFFRNYLTIRTASEDVPEIRVLVSGRVGPQKKRAAVPKRE